MNDRYAVPCLYPLCAYGADDKGQGSAPAKVQIHVRVPGSKSITNRAMLLAALANGSSTLEGALFSDDSRHLIQCLTDLGFPVACSEEDHRITVTGFGGSIPKDQASVYVGSAGTAARFLAAFLGCSMGTYHMDASAQMRKRPMAPLLRSLRELGAQLHFDGQEGYFPFTITGHGFGNTDLTVNIEQSSQFLSALLISSVCAPADVTIHTEGSHGMAYIEITTRMMAQFGVQAAPLPEGNGFYIAKNQRYTAGHYAIEPDVSAACYFYAMAPLLGIDVTVQGVHADSMQGDLQFLPILEQLGCQWEDRPEGILLHGIPDGRYPGITVDMSACSDQAITMAALAPFAQTPTTITGIGHIRHQESNRIQAICTELTRMGIPCQELTDGVRIWPGTPHPTRIETYEDHRMAMGFSLVGLRAPGIEISDPGCCRKTFENYFQVLDSVIARLTAGADKQIV